MRISNKCTNYCIIGETIWNFVVKKKISKIMRITTSLSMRPNKEVFFIMILEDLQLKRDEIYFGG